MSDDDVSASVGRKNLAGLPMRSRGSLKKFATVTLCLLIFGSGGPFSTTANSQTAPRLSDPIEQLTLTQAVEVFISRDSAGARPDGRVLYCDFNDRFHRGRGNRGP